jgi:RND family efflux transporter MFP subunit
MIRKIVPVVILVSLLGLAYFIKSNPPQSKYRDARPAAQMLVETQRISTQSYPVRVQSYGTVAPRTQTALVAQVGGQIVEVSPAFRDGGFFNKGDVLMRIDGRDYDADVNIAQAAVIDAQQALAEAQARSEQARKDWERLGNSEAPSPLVLREPQLQAARARVLSAQSTLDKARLDRARADIVAPYSGRVLDAQVDVGQVLVPGTAIATVYATDVVEIRLPLRNADLPFVQLPVSARTSTSSQGVPTRVEIRSELGTPTVWPAQLVRTEGAIDPTARQLHVIAQIDDPFGPGSDGRTPLKIGQYVTAEVEGIVLDNVIVIPNSAIYQGSYAYTVEEGVLQRKQVQVAWQNDTDAVIKAGLVTGDELVTTSLGQVTSGVRVTIAGRETTALQTGAAPTAGATR